MGLRMHNFSQIEDFYNKFIKNPGSWNLEGIFMVNLDLLHHFDLLHFGPDSERTDGMLERYFHMAETPDKLTLVNDQFVIWIFPSQLSNEPVTYTMIALNHKEGPKLEVVFIASGVYNQSNLIMRVLESFLEEIQDNERMLSNMEKPA